jgi:membrane fusion protein, multidrug efflux system
MDDRTTTDFTRLKPIDPAPAEAEPVEPMLRPPPLDKPAPSKRKSKTGRRLGLLVLVAGVGAAWWYYYRGREPQQEQTQAPAPQQRGGRFNPYANAMPVVVAPATTGDIDITLNALGTVTSLATVTIMSQISGYLTAVDYQEGQVVKQGDLLAEIDDRPYKLALQNAQGALARDEAMLQSAELDLKRYQDLAKTNAVPRQQLDQQVALVDQDKANILSDQAQIDTQKLNIVYCHIIAPVSGRVGIRLVDPGNYVTPQSTTGLVVITQFQPITVIFPVAEDYLPQITKRLKEVQSLPVTAFDRSNVAKLATGELKILDNQIDTTTGTLKLRAQFANDDEALFPNQFVNVTLLVDTLKGATVMPTAAVQRGAPGTFVYLLNKDQTVTVQKVKLGPSSGERVAVEEGLSVGDKVVIDGADKLRNGAKVVPRDATGNATGGGAAAAADTPAAATPAPPAAAIPAPPAVAPPAVAPPASSNPATLPPLGAHRDGRGDDRRRRGGNQ